MSGALDPTLLTKAKALKDSKLFTNPRTSEPELFEKQNIFLVLAGIKPLTEILSYHEELTKDGLGKIVADPPKEVMAFVQSLGLVCDLSLSDEDHTLCIIASGKDRISEYLQSDSRSFIKIGSLFGFPRTAAEAYEQAFSDDGDRNLCLSFEEQDKIEQDAHLFTSGAGFFFSRAHWHEELELVKQWQDLLEAYGLGSERY